MPHLQLVEPVFLTSDRGLHHQQKEALEAPKDGAAETPALRDAEMSEGYEPTEAVESADENMPKEGGSVKAEDLSASSTSMARIQLESERESKREKSVQAFSLRRSRRREKP
jgi:hypothetical protein